MGIWGVCYNDTLKDKLLGGHNQVTFAGYDLTDKIHAEAFDAGYTFTWTMSGTKWSKPK